MKARTKIILNMVLLATFLIQIFLFDQCVIETKYVGCAQTLSLYYQQQVDHLQKIKLLSKNNPEAVESTVKYISYTRLDEEISRLQKNMRNTVLYLKKN